MTIPSNITKYLSRQSNSNWKIELKNNRLYNNVIIIPAQDEFENIPTLLDSISACEKMFLDETLILIVVNNAENEDKIIIENNFTLLRFLREKLEIDNSNLNIGILDASTPGRELPSKSAGVGHARKIGIDLSLNLFDYSNNKQKLIICLDADCIVEKNYLSTIINVFNLEDINSAVVKFAHEVPQDERQKFAIINYELFLRYYVLGLNFANSRYAFCSVGSTIVCNVDSYIKSGGMNKRKAGEDFYFLEKLAKLSKIKKINGTTVYPSARISNRVPFGTGPRIKRFIENTHDEYKLYSPKIFIILKKWLELFEGVSNTVQSEIILAEAESINTNLHNFLIEQNFKVDWDNIIRNSNSSDQIKKQKLFWMDGFRTLKLVHYLRDTQFPNINMFLAIGEMLELMNIQMHFQLSDDFPSYELQKEILEQLRKHT